MMRCSATVSAPPPLHIQTLSCLPELSHEGGVFDNKEIAGHTMKSQSKLGCVSPGPLSPGFTHLFNSQPSTDPMVTRDAPQWKSPLVWSLDPAVFTAMGGFLSDLCDWGSQEGVPPSLENLFITQDWNDAFILLLAPWQAALARGQTSAVFFFHGTSCQHPKN